MFHFQVDMCSIGNITNVLSKNLKFLFLGDLDIEIFNRLLTYIKEIRSLKKVNQKQFVFRLGKVFVTLQKKVKLKKKQIYFLMERILIKLGKLSFIRN